MTMKELVVVPAGAGSGKTYRIMEDLGRWVESGVVRPDRIVAVTFTEAAAGELRDRVRRRLLDLGRLEDALLLDQAYVSTIHAFGLRIVTEFAFDAGQSPSPRLLTEDEQQLLIRRALAQTEKADVVLANLAGYGYRYDFNRELSAADLFREDILGVVAKLRSIGWRPEAPCDLVAVRDWIAERYGPVCDGETATEALRVAVARLLESHPESLAAEAKSDAARKDFNKDYRNLRKALRDGELEHNWTLWNQLRGLRLGKRGAPVPKAYQSLGEAVAAAADALVAHPGPLAQAQGHIEALLESGQEVLVHYANAKAQAGLLDYDDMIALADQLLADRPDVREELVRRTDCLVVDEFQDTNPLQFSLLWRLKSAGIPTLIVGDLKQAIMGFQGADPRLFEGLIAQNADKAEPLVANWRSQPSLMAIINEIGCGLFGDAYTELAPQADPAELEPLEIIEFTKRAPRDQHRIRAAAVGDRLKTLLEDSEVQVTDKRTNEQRGLQGRDIAVLCQTHKVLEQYAEILRAQGLKVRLQQEGWFECRSVQLAFYALSYVANPCDRHAALYLAVTELGGLSLEEGIKNLITDGAVDAPIMRELDALACTVASQPVASTVADVLQVVHLYDNVARWPDAAQARANLLRLQAEAAEFVASNRDARAAGGFHGDTLATFLGWLAIKVQQKDGNKQPAARVLDEDAIELVTWHAAKGREWPIVVVGDMDRKVEARLPELGVGYESFSALDQILSVAAIEYAPDFAAPEACERFKEALQARAEQEARRLLYVAVTRAREKLVLEWPGFAVGKGTTPLALLVDGCNASLTEQALVLSEASFHIKRHEGGSELPAELSLGFTEEPVELARAGRSAIMAGEPIADVTHDSVSPSQVESTSRITSPLEVIVYADRLEVPAALAGAEFGTIAHRFFEAVDAPDAIRHRLDDFARSAGLADGLIGELHERATRFDAWLREHLEPIAISREVPILYRDGQSRIVNGVIDLLIETSSGWLIVDHKSDQIDESGAAFERYFGQLSAYREALTCQGKGVIGMAVNWIRAGSVAWHTVQDA